MPRACDPCAQPCICPNLPATLLQCFALRRWKHGVRSALNAFPMFKKTGAVRDGEVVWRLDEPCLRQEQEAQAMVRCLLACLLACMMQLQAMLLSAETACGWGRWRMHQSAVVCRGLLPCSMPQHEARLHLQPPPC